MAVRIAVCVAQVGLLGDEIVLTADARAVDPAYLESGINEWDVYAVEEALRIRDEHGGEVVAVTAGGASTEPVLRRALAMGADRAIRATSPALEADDNDPLVISAALAVVLQDAEADLVLCGMQTSDWGSGATGGALGARLGLPVETCVVGLTWNPTERLATVRRELEGGLIEIREVQTPAVLTIQSGINEPRYATFRALKQAEQREITTIVGPPVSPGARVIRLLEPRGDHQAEMIVGSPADIAARITTIVRERLAR